MDVVTEKKSNGEDEFAKMHFEETQWNKLSIYEKKEFEIMMRNHESLLARGLNIAVPKFVIEKKRTQATPTLETEVQESEVASNIALLSLNCYSQNLPVEKDAICNEKNLSSESPAQVSWKRNINQASEKSVCGNCVMGGILANIHVEDRSVVLKESEKFVGLQEKINCFNQEKGTNATEVFPESEKCPHCDYSNVRLPKRHIGEVHKRERPYKCEECDYRAFAKCRLQDHVLAVHKRERRYKCGKCEYKAFFKSSVKRHIREVHKRERPYKCEKCDYKAFSKFRLQEHLLAVHDEIRLYQCEKCEFKAFQKYSVKRHMDAVHEGKKPHKCPDCNFSAGYACSLSVDT